MTGVRMSWVTLDRIVSKEARSDQAIRRQLEQNARPLRSHAASMGDEALLAKLRGVGVDADREKLAKLCEGALSAEEVVSERLRLHDWDADWGLDLPGRALGALVAGQGLPGIARRQSAGGLRSRSAQRFLRLRLRVQPLPALSLRETTWKFRRSSEREAYQLR